MAERDQLRRALRRHDAGDARHRQHVALLRRRRSGSAPASPAASTTRARAVAVRSVSALADDIDHARRGPRASKWVNPGSCRRGQQRARRRRDVRLAHQALADQEAAAPRPRRAGARSAWLRMPLSAIRKRSGGTSGASSSVVARSVSKVLRLRLLMPISGVSSPQRAVELASVVHLDQHVHVQRAGQRLQLARLGVGQRRHDQQDAVGAHRAALEHLPGIEDEILAQHRQVDGRARRLQMRRRCPGNAARRSAPRGRSRRRRDRRGPAPAGRNRRGSARPTATPS